MIQDYKKYEDDLSCSPILFSSFGGHDNYHAGYRNTGSTNRTCPAAHFSYLCLVVMIIMMQEYRNTGSTKTTCPVLLFYSLCVVVMIITIQEYRNTGITKMTCPAVLSNYLCLVVMIIMIQEFSKYKDDLPCSPLLFSLSGGHDNYDTGIQ